MILNSESLLDESFYIYLFQVYPKIIASGNQTQPAAQIIVASASGDTQTTQGIKFLANNVSGANAGKTFTLAQAQQMGLITTSKMQHILPSTQKQQV